MSEGSKVKEGFTIQVIVNEGVDLVRVPGLINRTLEEADALLREAGLEVGTTNYLPSDTTPENMIMRQEPEAFTNLEPGSKVNIVISQGEEIKPVIMPKVTGMNIIDAKNTLLGLDLIPGDVKEQPSSEFEKDLVMWQEYEPGVELENKTVVDLYVSLGPDEEDPEDTEGPDNGEGEEGDNGQGNENGQNNGNENKEGPFKLSITPFTDREETEVRVMRKQDGNTQEVYKKKHKASQGESQINVKGKIGAEFEVYFDDIYQFTRVKEE